MHARYERVLDTRLLPSLLPGGALHFLLSASPVDDRYALDIQLRERNKIIYYHGTARVLTVQFRIGRTGVEAKAHAAGVFDEYPGCQQQYRALMRWWGIGDAHAFQSAFLAYLPVALAATEPQHYRNQQEGYWLNRLCVRYGRQWTRADQWLIIDRECVVGFNHAKEQNTFYSDIARGYQGVKDQLQKQDPGVWGGADDKPFSDELDLLAINPGGDLAAIELKHGANRDGICWGPLQVSFYRDAFAKITASIRGDIRALVEQKIVLGLLPVEARGLLAASPLTQVEPILAVAEPNDQSKAWQMIAAVVGEMERARVPKPPLPLRIAKIRNPADIKLEIS